MLANMVISTEHLPTWTLSAASEPERGLLVDEDSARDLPEMLSSDESPERETTIATAATDRWIRLYSWTPRFERTIRLAEKQASAISSQIRRRAESVRRTLSGLQRRYALLFGGNFQPQEGESVLPFLLSWNPVSANSLRCTN
tara:strand:- start:3403 stop:3831 length:429 start_codon:yes stop_codon:yes gene_type:complete